MTIVDDSGQEVLRKAAIPLSLTEYALRTQDTGGGGGGAPQLTTPNVVAIQAVAADTEYSYSLPASSKFFSIRVRSGGLVKFAYASGEIASGNFLTRGLGSDLSRNISESASITIYYSAFKAGTILEVESWS